VHLYDRIVSNPFPSLKASALLAVLCRELGYEIVRRRGSHRRLEAEGRPTLTFAFHDSASLSPGEVRDILVKQARLSQDEALKVVK
jgi:predicted RNA binding protein YcfA (HicA-like mRNA interferase family)